ncbi:MAG: substrate-binding domain-containing protein [Planctomycetota bacterium]
MPRLLMAFLGSAIVIAALIFSALLLRPDARRDSASGEVVRVYCASGIAKPVEEVIAAYNEQFGTRIEIVRTGGSGELAGQIRTEFESGVRDGADIYVTADDLLLENAHQNGVIAERFPLAEQKPVIAVAADSGLEFATLKELVESPDTRFGVASSRAAVGKLARSIAGRDGVLSSLESQKATDGENVMTLAQALVAGSLDAAVIWDTTVAQLNSAGPEDVLKIACPADSLDEYKSNIAVGVVATTSHPTACLRFARFLTAPEKARASFENYGFSFLPGDIWEEIPEIHLFSGSMFTPVLEEAVREFASREGVNIYPRWEGCGKLVATMQSTEDADMFPDGYLACDMIFLEQVEEHFEPCQILSTNRIVLAVRQDVGHSINQPSDLLSGELRVGLCDPELSALGNLTRKLLSESPYDGLYAEIKDSSAVTVDVGPTLISQLSAGGLDAAFVYRSNVLADDEAAENIRMIELDSSASHSVATQPWAVSRSTANPQLMNRFFDWITRPALDQQFDQFGFERE